MEFVFALHTINWTCGIFIACLDYRHTHVLWLIAAHALCFVLYRTTTDEDMSKGSDEDGDDDNGEDWIEVRLGRQRWWWGLQTAPMMIQWMRTLSFHLVHFANPLISKSYVDFYVTQLPVRNLYVTHYTTTTLQHKNNNTHTTLQLFH